MRKLVIMFIIFSILLSAEYSYSLLYTAYRGPDLDKVVYFNGNWWYPDMPAMVNMTYAEQIDYINNLNLTNYGGISNWRMATRSEAWGFEGIIFSGTFFPETYVTPFNLHYYDGTYYMYFQGRTQDIQAVEWNGIHRYFFEVDVEVRFYFDRLLVRINGDEGGFSLGDNDIPYNMSAWVIASPEPTTVLLLCFGFIGLAGIRRKHSN